MINEEYLKYILLNERVGEFGLRALLLTLKRSTKDNKGIPILKSLRILEVEIEDEGIRTIHQFKKETNNSSLNLIELLNDNIASLECEHQEFLNLLLYHVTFIFLLW
jgi:hypothetical protein